MTQKQAELKEHQRVGAQEVERMRAAASDYRVKIGCLF